MLRKQNDEESEPSGPPCSVCADVGAEYMAWGSRLCVPCFRAWNADPGVRKVSAMTHHEDTAAAYRKATADFLAARKRVAA